MSRKYQRQKQKQKLPRVIVAIGGILLVIAAFLFANQDNGGIPSLAVEPQRIDFGDVKFNDPKTFAIKVTNTGNGILRFKEPPYIEVVEGC